jgi:hypothetical protein
VAFDATANELTVEPRFTGAITTETWDIIAGVDIIELVSIALAGQP